MQNSFIVPVEEWERLTKACDLVLIFDQTMKMKKGEEKPISVKVEAYGSQLYTAFSISYTSLNSASPAQIEMYRLCPVRAYEGETTIIYHDDDAIKNGKRKRGDHTGLIVSHRGKQYVCAERCHVLRGFPSTTLNLSLAIEHEKQLFAQVALGCGRMEARKEHGVVWKLYDGHPVACHGEIRTLFWAMGKSIALTTLDGGAVLDDVSPTEETSIRRNLAAIAHTHQPAQQLSLF
ncbi:MAG: hypothetical protein ACFHHU_00375 [Porticoccaceae bacterium]